MYKVFMNANGKYYVSWEDTQGFHGQPQLWTRQNQYTLKEAQSLAQEKNKQHRHAQLKNRNQLR